MSFNRNSIKVVTINSKSFFSSIFTDTSSPSCVTTTTPPPPPLGSYEICVSFGDKHLSPCPFWVFVYSSEYFPKAYNDAVSVWEDESVSFDALGNDYFDGGTANIVESSMPLHGSLLQYFRLFRYTPYKGFFDI
ncbi:hypothetical protein MKX01_038540 [Papaver californicum]|nr:hypothetical protein MKX01_038540 [Papaver californicum]